MLLSCSTNTFGLMPWERALDHIAGIGYQGVELLADRPHLFPPVSAVRLRAVRRRVDRLGLRVVNINANTATGVYCERHPAWAGESLFGPSLCDARQLVRKERVAHAIHSLELADRVGSPSICVTSGRAGTGCLPEEALKWLLESLRFMIKRAAAYGVRVGLEYEPGLLVESAQGTLQVIKQLNSPWLGLNFDMGHAVVCGENLPQVIGAFGTRIVHVHVEDIIGRTHYHRIPGEGDINFTQVIRTLRQSGYRGALTVELYPYANRPIPAATRAFRYLSRVLDRLG